MRKRKLSDDLAVGAVITWLGVAASAATGVPPRATLALAIVVLLVLAGALIGERTKPGGGR